MLQSRHTKMKLGEVRVAEDEDFKQLIFYVDNHEGWELQYSKGSTFVWTKSTDQTDFKMIKLRTVYKDVGAALVYDVLHDPNYRKVWDTHMLESYDIGCLNPNNDIGYYAMNCPSPLKKRDFVVQRSWLDTGKEYLLLNHSVYHETIPPKKGFIRAISHLTGFVVRPLGDHSCELSYVTQSDPKGSVPPWLVNKLSQIFVPKMLKRMHKAYLGYDSWKKKHNPAHKPWLYPEQMTLPRISLIQCVNKNGGKPSEEEEEEAAAMEEGKFQEKDFLNSSDE